MFWLERIVKESAKRRALSKRSSPVIVRDEKTASGRIHVGSLRGVVLHGAVAEALSDAGLPAKYYYEINDFDPFDDIPQFLSKERFEPFLGKPLCMVPSPDETASNYAEYFGSEFIGVIKALGFLPEFYRASDYYKAGTFNQAIRIALQNAPLIRKIYEEVSGGGRAEDWLPVSVICGKCGKIGTTKAVSFDGESVSYECGDFVDWAKGCGNKSAISPFDGNAKLLWKVEWAAKFMVLGVDVEGAGKDHSTKGGARDIADRIAREVFRVEPPVNMPYEFFHVAGRKMSTSRGAGISAVEMSELLPPHILRFLMIYKDPARVIDFEPDGDTIPVLYDSYDRYAENFWRGKNDDFSALFKLAHPKKGVRGVERHLLPRFSQVAYLVQMPHLHLEEEIERLYGVSLTALDKAELEERARYARIWIALFAPPDYKFEIQKALPEETRAFSDGQKAALRKVSDFIQHATVLDGDVLHKKLHDIKGETGLPPADFFSAIYFSILGKRSGPKAGWFLSVLDRPFLIQRLREAGGT